MEASADEYGSDERVDPSFEEREFSHDAKLIEAWKIIANMTNRLRFLETLYLQRFNYRPRVVDESGAPQNPANNESPLLAGIYKYEEIMSQAAEYLKNQDDWIVNADGVFPKVADNGPPAIPEPPPDVHSFRTCGILPMDTIPINQEPSAMDQAIARILALIEPHESQRMYRSSVKTFMARIVRRTIGSKLFEIGYHAQQYFLPTDPLRFSVIVAPIGSLATEWLPLLGEKLRVLSDKSSDTYQSTLAEIMNPSDDDPVDDVAPEMVHMTSSVELKILSGYSLKCVFDSENLIEVVANGVNDLRFAAFLDEVSQLVGKGKLFNRSMLLIRSWWIYQAHENKGEPVLSDVILCVLVVSIFNQHHARIFHPLQALSLFLAEFSELDWGEYAVTLQGVVPFRKRQSTPGESLCSPALESRDLEVNVIVNGQQQGGGVADGENSEDKKNDSAFSSAETPATLAEGAALNADAVPSVPWLRYPASTDLLNAPFLQKYFPEQDLFTTNYMGTPKFRSPVGTPAIGDRDLGPDVPVLTSITQPGDTGALQGSPNPAGGGIYPAASLDEDDGAQTTETSITGYFHKIDSFIRLDINVVHPLTHENMMQPLPLPATGTAGGSGGSGGGEKSRVDRLSSVFESGAKELSIALQGEGGETLVSRFFMSVTNTFKDGFRPDVFSGSQSLRRYVRGISSPKLEDRTLGNEFPLKDTTMLPIKLLGNLWEQFAYVDLVLTGQVRECSVLALTKEIIIERGTLPVGEIGKVLQEVTHASTVSSRVKERFGGLKKFLERFPDEFILCADHQFNPHVFVKKVLNAEDLELVMKGTVPNHLTAKFKRALAQRAKKQKAAQAAMLALGGEGSDSFGASGRSPQSAARSTVVIPNTLNTAAYRAAQASIPGRIAAGRASNASVPIGAANPLAHALGLSTSSFTQLQHQQLKQQFYNANSNLQPPISPQQQQQQQQVQLQMQLPQAMPQSQVQIPLQKSAQGQFGYAAASTNVPLRHRASQSLYRMSQSLDVGNGGGAGGAGAGFPSSNYHDQLQRRGYGYGGRGGGGMDMDRDNGMFTAGGPGPGSGPAGGVGGRGGFRGRGYGGYGGNTNSSNYYSSSPGGGHSGAGGLGMGGLGGSSGALDGLGGNGSNFLMHDDLGQGGSAQDTMLGRGFDYDFDSLSGSGGQQGNGAGGGAGAGGGSLLMDRGSLGGLGLGSGSQDQSFFSGSSSAQQRMSAAEDAYSQQFPSLQQQQQKQQPPGKFDPSKYIG